MFWRTPLYWSQDSFRWQSMAAVIRPLILIERLVLFSANLLFIILSLLAAGLAVWPKSRLRSDAERVITRLRSTATSLPSFLWCLAGTIWIASILQTLLDHGDNPRFLVPLQSLVVLWVLWFVWQFCNRVIVGRSIETNCWFRYGRHRSSPYSTSVARVSSAHLKKDFYETGFLTNKNIWLTAAAVAGLAAILAAVDGTGRWLPGWIAYAIVGGLGAGSIFGVWHFTGREASMGKIALAAVFLRLAVGVALMLLLPEVGYADNESHQGGYFYYDAAIRDRQAWQMAQSDAPLWKAFSGEYSGDQYGGMLALSAGIYRLLSPDAHRPWLILLLTAAAAGWGVLCLGKAAQSWFGERTARLAVWIFALYPEGILLGGTHMREAFVIPAIAMTCLSLTEMRTDKRAWLGWLGLAAGLLFFFQPPAAVVALVVLAGAWFFDPHRQRAWKRVLLISAILILGVLLVFSIWASLPSLRSSSPLTIFFDWLQNNYKYQTHLIERSSGCGAKIIPHRRPAVAVADHPGVWHSPACAASGGRRS